MYFPPGPSRCHRYPSDQPDRIWNRPSRTLAWPARSGWHCVRCASSYPSWIFFSPISSLPSLPSFGNEPPWGGGTLMTDPNSAGVGAIGHRSSHLPPQGPETLTTGQSHRGMGGSIQPIEGSSNAPAFPSRSLSDCSATG